MDSMPTVEMPKVDISGYIGNRVKIAKAEVIETQYGRAIRFETEIIDILGTKEKPLEIKASKLIGIHQDESGTWGIAKDSKAEEFFNLWKIKHHKDMVGKTVIVQATEAKNGIQFLTFA
jgi:RNA binding exosome subunit